MQLTRRHFVQSSASICGFSVISQAQSETSKATLYKKLDTAAKQPVLKKQLFSKPIIIQSVELLRHRNNFLCRVRSKEGAEGISVSHNTKMRFLYPIQVQQVQPFFVGKDARNLDALIDQVYVHNSNYKMQSLALWIPVATVEFAILDMLGKITNKSIGQLIGDIHHPKIAIYQANNYRGLSAEESIKRIKKQVEQTGAKAVKFKLGGRMRQKEKPEGRSDQLIPLMRKTFGSDMVIYADANGAYDVKEAIRIGRLLEKHKIDFYEEPVPFDWYEETQQIANTLSIPIAGGEQEPSIRNFRWLLAHQALQICQPDLFYFGGMIRSMRVARMAHTLGCQCTPHISGTGLGYLYMMQFVSALPNAGPYHEFKGVSRDIPFQCKTSSMKSEQGKIQVPTGPGAGIAIDPDFVKKHQLVK